MVVADDDNGTEQPNVDGDELEMEQPSEDEGGFDVSDACDAFRPILPGPALPLHLINAAAMTNCEVHGFII